MLRKPFIGQAAAELGNMER